MTTILINGDFVDIDQARIGVFDAGFQHGVGLFETMTALVTGGESKVISLDEHLDRIILSAKELGLASELSKSALEEAVVATVERAGDARQRVRLTLTGGDMNLTSRDTPARAHEPTVVVAAQPMTPYPDEMYRNGVMVVAADMRINPLDESQGHKTLNYWMRLRELQKAAAKRAGEALVFTITNHLAGGCVSNVILVKGGQIITPIARGEEIASASFGKGPVLRSPVLPGITRATVLSWTKENSREVVKRMVTLDDVFQADEVFLTNSIFGALPVVAFEKQTIGAGTVGAFTAEIIARWKTTTTV